LCAEAAKPRQRGSRAMRINAGSPVETAAPSYESDLPAHLRTGRQKDDPWADEGT